MKQKTIRDSLLVKFLFLLFAFTSFSGCFSTVSYHQIYDTTPVTAVTALGDTVQIPTYQFYTNYQYRPSYYNDWRFYYRDTWYNPHSYYTTYYNPYWYRPFNTWNYTPYKYPSQVEPKRESKPRSSGTTSGTKRTEPKSEPRTTGRTQPQKSERPKDPQRKKRGGS